MADEDTRRLEREAEHDPAARVALEVDRERRGVEPEDAPETPTTPYLADQEPEEARVVRASGPALPPVGGRPRKEPLWFRSVLEKGSRRVELLAGRTIFDTNVPSISSSPALPVASHFFWYGVTLYPTVTAENTDAVLRLWETGRYAFLFSGTRELHAFPTKLVMPNPVLLPHFGVDMEACVLALRSMEPKLAARIIRSSLFAQPIRDVTVSKRPIEVVSQEQIDALVELPEPAEEAIELLFVMFGIYVKGIVS